MKASGMSQLDFNVHTGKISNHHFYNRESGQIELVSESEEVFEFLKKIDLVCGEIFSCPSCKVIHVSIRYDKLFLGFSLCELCTTAIDSLSTVPFVITNARTGERHKLELRLLK